MDDSDQDFADLCSKLLKRVRRKAAAEPALPGTTETRSSSQKSDADDRSQKKKKKQQQQKKKKKEDGGAESKPSHQGKPRAERGDDVDAPVREDAPVDRAGDGGPAASGGPAGGGDRPVDQILVRMQRFKRFGPQTLVHGGDAAPRQPEETDEPGPGDGDGDGDSDAVLALRLQQDLDRQAAAARDAEALEDQGLFFCQLCQRDLSHMTAEGRTQHLNRCLDETEHHPPAPPPPPPPPSVADCPICGKRFKSQKSRTVHLKRCSTELGVAPAVLLQCLQRQGAEVQQGHDDTGNPPCAAASSGSKRKEPVETSLPVRKRPRKKAQPLDEETMVALALSSSLLEQERQTAASLASMAPGLRGRLEAEAGKGRRRACKRRNGGGLGPPPLLLVQDAEVAQARLQERVAALLLRPRAPSPPTPPRAPSALCSAASCSLWSKSKLVDVDPNDPGYFYSPELRELLMPTQMTMTSGAKENLGSSSHSPIKADTEVTSAGSGVRPNHPSSSQTAPSPSPTCADTGSVSVGSQAMRDVMELAQEGRTLSQWLREDAGIASDFGLSGFVTEESKEPAKLCLSGFLPPDSAPKTTATTSQPIGGSGKPRGRPESGGCKGAALSRLCADLGSMVNNPQLSDVQLQADSGDVYFVHSFVLYARCPLLAQMVHDSGFGVQEEGLPSAQRVLLEECPGEAVLALLQYLYTGRCAPTPPTPLLELATRFDLVELQHLCQQEMEAGPREDDNDNDNDNINLSLAGQEETALADQDFMQLLRSMWSEEDGEEGEPAEPGTSADAVHWDEEEKEGDGGRQDRLLIYGDGELEEEHMNDEELEEIYEFAATQRKLAEERDSTEQEEEEQQEEEENDEEATSAEDNIVTKAGAAENEETLLCLKAGVLPERSPGCRASSSLDYSRLFSGSWGVCEEFPASSRPSNSQTSTSCDPKAPKSQMTPPHRHSPSRAFPSERTCLQSPPSRIIDLSVSSPCLPTGPSRPLPGLSPGGDEGALYADTSRHGRPGNPSATDTRVSQRRDGHSPGICQPASPEPPQGRQEPELIVLSDSSEEEAAVRDPVPAASPGPSPPLSPVWMQSPQQYTGIKPYPAPSTSPTARRSGEGGSDGGPGSAHDAVDPDQMGFSPEVSWLVPATPPKASSHSTRTSSICTQTQSSICRTRLFPSRASASSSPRPAAPSSSPCRPKVGAQASGGRPPTDAPLAPGSVNTSSIGPEFSFDDRPLPVTRSPPAQHYTQPRPPSFSHLPHSLSERSTPAHARPRPYSSSTPLHAEPPEPPVPLGTSLLPDGPEREELGRTRPSQSDPPDGISPGLSQKSNDRSRSTGDTDGSRRCTLGSDHRHSDSVDLHMEEPKRMTNAHGSEVSCEGTGGALSLVEGEERGLGPEGEHGQVSETSLCQSFVDEPPMAFSDSWCQAPCFSLRLEESDPYQHSTVSPRSPHPPGTQSHDPEGEQNPSASTLPAHHPLAEVGTPTSGTPPEVNSSLQDPQLWDSWEEDEKDEEESRDLALALAQRVNPAARFQTPVSSRSRKRTNLVPITPMPTYSDMDTPELKNKLNRFGVRPLPKQQMILKLREIHQYTHQLVHSDEEEEGGSVQTEPPAATTSSARPLSYAQQEPQFKQPRAPTGCSPGKRGREEEEEEEEDAAPLSSSQGSGTSSTAASEDSGRSNPELLQSDSESDGEGGITASQAACRNRDRVQAVRAFILSDPELYSQVLRYQPLVLCQLQARLKATGIRLGAAKLLDYLDSQCITVTTAKPGQSAAGRRRGKAKGARTARAAGDRGAARGRRKRTIVAS